MTALVLPARFYRQPQQAVPIDWANPLISWADDIFVPLGQNFVRFSRSNSVLTGTQSGTTVGVKATDQGVGVLFNANGVQFAKSAAYATTAVTVLAVCTPLSNTGGEQYITGVWDYFANGFALRLNAGNWSCRLDNGSLTDLNGGSFAVGRGGAISMAWDGATLSLMEPNGALSSAAISGTAANPAASFTIGGLKNTASYPFTGAIHLVIAGRRAANQAQRQALHSNPWQLFKAPPRRIWVAVAGGGGPTIIDLSTASMGLSAKSLQTRLASALTTASLTTSGKAIQPRLATGLTAASMPLSAQSLQTSAIVRLGSAAMGFTAQAITLVRDTVIQLTAATLRFSAKAITVTFEGVVTALGSWKRGLQSRRNKRNNNTCTKRR